MKNKGELAPPESERWTRPDEYIGALARRRSERKKREPKIGRTQPEVPRFALSTLPFLALLIVLAALTIGMIVAAWPGSQPRSVPRPAVHQQGVAPKGWLQEAEKEMRR